MRKGMGVTGLELLRREQLEERLRKLERVADTEPEGHSGLREVAAEKLRQGANLTRGETAAYVGVSTKMIQRMEERGQIRRCPALGGVVRYAARDVLKLASAPGKEA